MRDIKFRAKRDCGDDWMYGMLLKNDKFYFIQDKYGTTDYADENTIGQYTGLKDKNGKEIYEGDIVRFRFKKDRPECPDLIGFIEYQEQYCSFKIVSSPENGSFRIDSETIIEVLRKYLR